MFIAVWWNASSWLMLSALRRAETAKLRAAVRNILVSGDKQLLRLYSDAACPMSPSPRDPCHLLTQHSAGFPNAGVV